MGLPMLSESFQEKGKKLLEVTQHVKIKQKEIFLYLI